MTHYFGIRRILSVTFITIGIIKIVSVILRNDVGA